MIAIPIIKEFFFKNINKNHFNKKHGTNLKIISYYLKNKITNMLKIT